MPTALDTSQAKTIGIVAILVLLAVGVLLSVLISAIVGRIVVLVVAVGLAALVWTQRSSIEDHVKNCDSDVTFLGVHVKLSSSAEAQCRAR